MANNAPMKPWVHDKNSSSASLSRLGLGKTAPPGQTLTLLSPANDYLRKELPPVPKITGDHYRRRPLSDQAAGTLDPSKNIVRSQHSNRIDGVSQPLISSKSQSLPDWVSRRVRRSHRQLSTESPNRVLPPPPPPSMTKSAQKVLQLTGFDPSFDQPMQSHYSVFPESSESSGSQYSQTENETQKYGAVPGNHWESASVAPTEGEPNTAFLQSSVYSVSEKSANVSELSVAAVAAATVSISSLRTRDRPVKDGDGQRTMVDVATDDSMENMTNEESITLETAPYGRQKRSRFADGFERDIGSRLSHKLTDAERRDLIPRALALRPKRKGRADAENEKLERHYTTPVYPEGMPYDGMPVGSKTQPPLRRPANKRSFGSGKHQLKSPFPFSFNSKGSESGESEQKLRKKFSRAMKRLSGGEKPPIKQRVISNVQREPNGPDTPMPSSFGFPKMLQIGNEHLQDAFDKAKKGLKIKTADEKRREDLKQQIVVVGVTDQSPGMVTLVS